MWCCGRVGFFFRSNGLRAGSAGDVFLSVKWLALRAGAPAAWGSFSFGQAACAPRGPARSCIKANCSLLMSKENQKTTSDFDALDPRERGCSPLSDPKGEVEMEKS